MQCSLPLLLLSLLAGGLATNPEVHVAPASVAPSTVVQATLAPATVAPATVAPATVAQTTVAPQDSNNSSVLGNVKDHLANAGATASAAAGVAAGALNHITDINATGANLTSVWGLIIGIMDKELHSTGEGKQMFAGGLSLVLGAVMLWDGLHVFEVYILLVTFFVVFILMMGNFQTPQYAQHFGLGTQLWQKILSLEVAFLISFTFKFSIGLIKKFLGLGLGVSAFLWLQSFLVTTAVQNDWGALDTVATSPTFFIVLALACFPFGVWLFAEGPSYVFAIIAPFFGAIMVSSAFFYFVTMFAPSPDGSDGPKPDWIDFLYFSIGTGNVTDIGPLEGKDPELGISFNRWALCTFAFLLFVGFGRRQFKIAQEEKTMNASTMCDKVMGCMADNCGGCKGTSYYEPLLRERDDRIRELEQQLAATGDGMQQQESGHSGD